MYGKQDEDVPAKLSPVDERVLNLISVGVRQPKGVILDGPGNDKFLLSLSPITVRW